MPSTVSSYLYILLTPAWVEDWVAAECSGRQPRTTRALFTRHRDRVLFGTDTFPPDARAYRLHYRFLESGDEKFPHDPDGVELMGRWAIDGLDLDDETLRAMYAGNAVRLIPTLAG